MSADRCLTCDREACPRAAYEAVGIPAKVRKVYNKMTGHDWSITVAEHALISKHADERNAADADCRARRVDWRAEALTLRARCLAAEAARDEATRRLAVVEEAVRSLDEGMAEIDDKRPHRRAIARMQLTGAITRLRAALEKKP